MAEQEVSLEVEKKANNNAWYLRKFFRAEICTDCGKQFNRGFIHSPGMNYPICLECGIVEFSSDYSDTIIKAKTDSTYQAFYDKKTR